jgi:hypothetical protein
MYVNEEKILGETVPDIREGGSKRAVEGVNSIMIYLIQFKNLCKCSNIPPPSTTIMTKKKKRNKEE